MEKPTLEALEALVAYLYGALVSIEATCNGRKPQTGVSRLTLAAQEARVAREAIESVIPADGGLEDPDDHTPEQPPVGGEQPDLAAEAEGGSE